MEVNVTPFNSLFEIQAAKEVVDTVWRREFSILFLRFPVSARTRPPIQYTPNLSILFLRFLGGGGWNEGWGELVNFQFSF